MPTFEEKLQVAVQYFQTGQLENARIACRKLLKCNPKHSGLLQLLGEITWQQGNSRVAINLFSKAIASNPQDPLAHYRLANVLFSKRKIDAAANHYNHSLRLKPDYWQAHVNLGLLWRSEGKFQQAREHFEQALEFNPSSTVVFGYLLDLLLSLGELSTIGKMSANIQSMVKRCIENDQEQDFAALMYLSPLLSVSKQDYDDLSDKMDRLLHKNATVTPSSTFLSGKRLRIGYVSPDFCDHPISHVMRGVFGQHDRDCFEIIAYSLSTRTGSVDREYISKILQTCDDYVDLAKLTFRQAAERIAADGISILVNLSGYMSPPGLEIFSWRPAPVQVYWLGHGGGLGLSFIDYVIADAVVIPPGEEGGYSESVVRMPDSYHCTDTPQIPGIKQTRAEHGLDDKAFVYCVFNNPNKIDGEVFEVWLNILRQVPGSQLWLSNPGGDSALENNLRAEARRSDIDPDRLVFARRISDKSLHFVRHQLADLFLDTFTYNASTTAIDSLWAGLPILTRLGNSFYSRICASHVSNAGLGQMVCASTREYEDRAVYYANNTEELKKIRHRLTRNVRTEALFDISRFVYHLEDAYQVMWKRYQSGEAPAGFNVASRPQE